MLYLNPLDSSICPYRFVEFYEPGHIADLNIEEYVTDCTVLLRGTRGIGSGPHKCA